MNTINHQKHLGPGAACGNARRSVQASKPPGLSLTKNTMNAVDTEIERLVGRIAALNQKVEWLRQHREKLAEVPKISIGWMDTIDFDNLTHSEVIQVIQALGGTWSKELNADKTKVDYTATIDGESVRCWAGEPPPSCRIVQVEEVIPAQPARTQMVSKLVCNEDNMKAV